MPIDNFPITHSDEQRNWYKDKHKSMVKHELTPWLLNPLQIQMTIWCYLQSVSELFPHLDLTTTTVKSADVYWQWRTKGARDLVFRLRRDLRPTDLDRRLDIGQDFVEVHRNASNSRDKQRLLMGIYALTSGQKTCEGDDILRVKFRLTSDEFSRLYEKPLLMSDDWRCGINFNRMFDALESHISNVRIGPALNIISLLATKNIYAMRAVALHYEETMASDYLLTKLGDARRKEKERLGQYCIQVLKCEQPHISRQEREMALSLGSYAPIPYLDELKVDLAPWHRADMSY